MTVYKFYPPLFILIANTGLHEQTQTIQTV
jgi:hypothetical protein